MNSLGAIPAAARAAAGAGARPAGGAGAGARPAAVSSLNNLKYPEVLNRSTRITFFNGANTNEAKQRVQQVIATAINTEVESEGDSSIESVRRAVSKAILEHLGQEEFQNNEINLIKEIKLVANEMLKLDSEKKHALGVITKPANRDQKIAISEEQRNELRKAIAIALNVFETAAVVAAEIALLRTLTKEVKNERLLHAAIKGDPEAVKALVQAGADIEATDRDGFTALMAAAYNGQTEAVSALVQAGANLEATDRGGMTALILPAYKGHTEAVTQAIRDGKQALIDQFQEVRDRRNAFSLARLRLNTHLPPEMLQHIVSFGRELSEAQNNMAKKYIRGCIGSATKRFGFWMI